MANILLHTVQSLQLKTFINGNFLEQATGFVIYHKEKYFLATNWHVVSGLDPRSRAIRVGLSVPDELRILHNCRRGLGHWEWRSEPLILKGKELWYEHPIFGSKVDLVLLPLTCLNYVKSFPYSIDEAAIPFDFSVGPTEIVSVIGFPFGLSGDVGFAIWSTGFVATEPALDFDELPLFLIDCRSRPGQSGSPVLAYRPNGSTLVDRDGNINNIADTAAKLMGVYSGRINAESDLGKVWKLSAIRAILNALPD